MPQHKKGHGGERKYGRNKAKCEQYRRERRREKNKARRIAAQKRREEKKRIKLQKKVA
jgi:hypothetical protein